MDRFLDTNVCIDALKGRSAGVVDQIRRCWPGDLKIPSMVKAELYLGAERSCRPDRTLRRVRAFLRPFEVVPFDSGAAEHYGRIRAVLERAGTPIGPADLVIAATVLSRAGLLVTHNTREFARVPGLPLEDWARPPES